VNVAFVSTELLGILAVQ